MNFDIKILAKIFQILATLMSKSPGQNILTSKFTRFARILAKNKAKIFSIWSVTRILAELYFIRETYSNQPHFIEEGFVKVGNQLPCHQLNWVFSLFGIYMFEAIQRVLLNHCTFSRFNEILFSIQNYISWLIFDDLNKNLF